MTALALSLLPTIELLAVVILAGSALYAFAVLGDRQNTDDRAFMASFRSRLDGAQQ